MGRPSGGRRGQGNQACGLPGPRKEGPGPPGPLTLRVADTIEVKRWILGWGAGAEVLEPERLRREIAAEARKIAERE